MIIINESMVGKMYMNLKELADNYDMQVGNLCRYFKKHKVEYDFKFGFQKMYDVSRINELFKKNNFRRYKRKEKGGILIVDEMANMQEDSNEQI